MSANTAYDEHIMSGKRLMGATFTCFSWISARFYLVVMTVLLMIAFALNRAKKLLDIIKKAQKHNSREFYIIIVRMSNDFNKNVAS